MMFWNASSRKPAICVRLVSIFEGVMECLPVACGDLASSLCIRLHS